MAARVPHRMPERMSEYMPATMSNRMSEFMPGRLSDRMSESEYLSESMADRMYTCQNIYMQYLLADGMSETMSEYCVRVGITRSEDFNGDHLPTTPQSKCWLMVSWPGVTNNPFQRWPFQGVLTYLLLGSPDWGIWMDLGWIPCIDFSDFEQVAVANG